MTTLQVVTNSIPITLKSKPTFSFRSKVLLLHGLRSSILVGIFFVILIFQSFQSSFLAPTLWLPVYLVLINLFLFNGLYFLFSEWCQERSWVHGFLFALDAVAVSLVLFFTGAQQSFFFFLFLIDILLAGLLFQRRGAFAQALWTSLLYSFLLLSTTPSGGGNIYLILLLNNLALFSVAYLSSNLSEQLQSMGTLLLKTENRLEQLTDLHQYVINNMGSGLITLDLEGRVIMANPVAKQILDSHNLESLNINQIFPEMSLNTNVVQLHSQKRERQQLELEFINRHHEKLLIEADLSPLKNENSHKQGYVFIFQDRTEIKRLEKSLRQKEKLAAIGQLAAGIAHEIRNPLASISGSIQLMSSHPEKYPEEDIKLMKIVNREIDRLNGLITEFLDYVRPEEVKQQKINLNNIIHEVLEIIRFNEKIRKDVIQQINLRAKCDIVGNRDKLKQAFLNIVLNAFQALENSPHPELIIETNDIMDRVVLTVKDNGEGMDEKTQSRLFEPFFTTKPKGTGLGLAVTHKILESHEAKTLIKSQKGRGTIFTIDFPGHKDHYHPLHPKAEGA
ncbi:MAG: PAS domain-containing protein [Bdellovibrionales bacterium]|nr:PAS domain-containing protein [Bdellovibrionales bacterium]